MPLCPWNSPGKNSRVDLLQEIEPMSVTSPAWQVVFLPLALYGKLPWLTALHDTPVSSISFGKEKAQHQLLLRYTHQRPSQAELSILVFFSF